VKIFKKGQAVADIKEDSIKENLDGKMMVDN